MAQVFHPSFNTIARVVVFGSLFALGGAALALATFQARGLLGVEFDSDLANRLPYDVAYWDFSVNQPAWLYREHTHYRQLKTMAAKTVPMVALIDDDRARRFLG